MKKSAGALLAAGAAMLLTAAACAFTPAREAKPVTKEIFAMDTFVTITAYNPSASRALSVAEKELRDWESLLSVTNENSDTVRINSAAGKEITVNSKTARLLAFALGSAWETGGAVDPTMYPVTRAWGFTTGNYRVPDASELENLRGVIGWEKVHAEDNRVRIPLGAALDFGAVAKGYVADEIAVVLQEEGISSALINLGGNVKAVGKRPDGEDFRVAVQSPLEDTALGVLFLSDVSAVTSGAYQRYFEKDGHHYGHIMDPATLAPAESGLASVTVVARESRKADALSTALYVMGRDGAEDFWRNQKDFDMVLVSDAGDVAVTEGLAHNFVASDAYKDRVEVIRR